MLDTLQNIDLPAGIWVDLYSQSSISVGTQLLVENLSNSPVRIYTGIIPPVDAENDDDTGSFSRIMGYDSKGYGDDSVGLWALSELGGLVNASIEAPTVTTTSLKSHDNKEALFTEFGELTVGMRIDDISINFHYGVSTKDTTDISTGTGSVTNIGSDAAINSGTGVGTGELVSLDSVRYRAGHESITMITHDQTDLESGVNVQHGLLDALDGLAIGSQGTVKGAWFVEGGNENFIPHTSFSEDSLDGLGPSKFDWDPTMRNLFMITFGYLSIAPIRYYIKTEAGWVLFHNIILINTQSEGHLKNPTLPVTCRVRRTSGSGGDVQVKTGSWRAGTVGPERQINAADRWFSFTASRVNLGSIDVGANPNTYHNMFTLSGADLFKFKPNHIRAEVAVVSFVVDGNKSVEFASVVNGTLTGNDPFFEVDAQNSVISTSIGGTVDGFVAGAATVLARQSDRRTSVRGTGIFVRPGDVVTTGARGINGASVTGDISASFRWVEEF